MSDNSIGELLKKFRGNMSLREASDLTKISHTYLSSLEKGFDPRTGKERKPTPDTLKKISEAYNCSYEELLFKAGYIDEALELALGDSYKLNQLPITGLAYINAILKPTSKLKFFDFLKDDIKHLQENLRKFGVTFPDNEPDVLSLRKIIMYQPSKEEIKKHGDLLVYLVNELNRMVFKVKQMASATDKLQPEMSEILLHHNLTFNGQPLTPEDRKLIYDMLQRMFPRYVPDEQ